MKRSKGTADHMMPLGNWFSFSFSFLGSGPKRGQSPVEWEISCPSFFASICPSNPPYQASKPASEAS